MKLINIVLLMLSTLISLVHLKKQFFLLSKLFSNKYKKHYGEYSIRQGK